MGASASVGTGASGEGLAAGLRDEPARQRRIDRQNLRQAGSHVLALARQGERLDRLEKGGRRRDLPVPRRGRHARRGLGARGGTKGLLQQRSKEEQEVQWLHHADDDPHRVAQHELHLALEDQPGVT